jgi:thiamine-monophosphate kinase
MNELELIKSFRASAPKHPWLLVGPGQDCAVLRWKPDRDIAFKIDQIVEGTHFVLKGPDAAKPKQIGWKAMAKACSDIAAAGCSPVAALAAVNLQHGSSQKLATELYNGMSDCCRTFGFALAGGDISTSEQGLSICVSMLGEGPRESPPSGIWTRAGAQRGDLLFVTGQLGASSKGKHLKFMPRLPEARAIRSFIPAGVHACIDITDGLSRDLHHICEESQCGAVVYEEHLPYSREAMKIEKAGGRTALDQALSDGEDFELLLAVNPDSVPRLERQWNLQTPLTNIGRIQDARKGIDVLRKDGSIEALKNIGYEHRV